LNTPSTVSTQGKRWATMSFADGFQQ